MSHMGNTKILRDRQRINTGLSRYRGKIKNNNQSWERHRRVVYYQRQGDPISPNTFITYLERVMDKIQDNIMGISIQRFKINNLRFSDDIDLIEQNFFHFSCN